MQQTLTVVLRSGAATWCRELSQEQVQAVAASLQEAAYRAAELASVADVMGDVELALEETSLAALYSATRDAWLDIAYADREEG